MSSGNTFDFIPLVADDQPWPTPSLARDDDGMDIDDYLYSIKLDPTDWKFDIDGDVVMDWVEDPPWWRDLGSLGSLDSEANFVQSVVFCSDTRCDVDMEWEAATDFDASEKPSGFDDEQPPVKAPTPEPAAAALEHREPRVTEQAQAAIPFRAPGDPRRRPAPVAPIVTPVAPQVEIQADEEVPVQVPASPVLSVTPLTPADDLADYEDEFPKAPEPAPPTPPPVQPPATAEESDDDDSDDSDDDDDDEQPNPAPVINDDDEREDPAVYAEIMAGIAQIAETQDNLGSETAQRILDELWPLIMGEVDDDEEDNDDY